MTTVHELPGEDVQARRLRVTADVIRDLLKSKDDEQLAALEDTTVFTLGDWVLVRERMALAQADGSLSYESAMLLAGIADHWAGRDLADRILWIQTLGEVMGL